ncbi:MAG: hypothetical protein HQK67_03320 [Desulfamplus sp.]|nr:hypothetical protein [Desulfamplus sp.]
MCNHCNDNDHDRNHDNDHTHDYDHHPKIIQIMPVQNTLFAVYMTEKPPKYSVCHGKNGISLVSVLFLALMQYGDQSMIEGFFASNAILSCEDVEGFVGYATSLEDAEKIYGDLTPGL